MGSRVENGAVPLRFHATAEGRIKASIAASATSPQRYFHAMDYPRSDLAAVSVFIDPAPEPLELELVDGALPAPAAPGACIAPLPPGWVTAGVAGLSAGGAGAAGWGGGGLPVAPP